MLPLLVMAAHDLPVGRAARAIVVCAAARWHGRKLAQADTVAEFWCNQPANRCVRHLCLACRGGA